MHGHCAAGARGRRRGQATPALLAARHRCCRRRGPGIWAADAGGAPVSNRPRAVILAGGKGTRLAPYTATFPKPLVPIGDMPILELVVRQLKRHAVERVTLTVNHLAALLQAYFGNGEKFGMDIDYSLEDRPLGTAGPLALLDGVDSTFLVLNGDLLTDLDYSQMLEQHRARSAIMTVGLYERVHTVDFGVVEIDNAQCISGYTEKPSLRYLVSMGVYVMEPSVLEWIEPGEHLDLPTLVNRLIEGGVPVHAFHHRGYWLDIGRPDDYQQAQADFPQLKERLLGS